MIVKTDYSNISIAFVSEKKKSALLPPLRWPNAMESKTVYGRCMTKTSVNAHATAYAVLRSVTSTLLARVASGAARGQRSSLGGDRVSARPRFALVFSRDWSSLGAKGTGEKLSPTWPTRTGGIWKSWDSMGGARQRVGTSILETASLSCVCKFSPGETSVTTFMRWTKSFFSLLSKSWSYK